MGLRCKKNDLARVVQASLNPEYLGYIVRCVEPFVARRGAAWVIEPPLGSWTSAYDFALEPLANPGDDAVNARDVLLGQRAAA